MTDVDLAIAHWQSVEHWGTPTEQTKNFEYAPPRNQRKDGWNAEIEAKRFESYQQLSQLLKAELPDLQAFRLSVPQGLSDSCEWGHQDYCVYIIIGKTTDGNWLCLLPTVPDQVTSKGLTQTTLTNPVKSPTTKTLELQSKIRSILAELPAITLYGYYYGAYNYTYQHQIIYAFSQSKALAIELALQSAGMLTVEKTNVEYASDPYNSQKLSQFFNANLNDRTIYTLNFWEISYNYEIGKASTGDWLGVRSLWEFEYNP